MASNIVYKERKKINIVDAISSS